MSKLDTNLIETEKGKHMELEEKLEVSAEEKEAVEDSNLENMVEVYLKIRNHLREAQAEFAKKEADKIGQIRADYLKLIEKYGAGEIKRAKMWAAMTKATKLFGKDAVEHPDWANRAEALKYIDSLAGIVVLKEQEVPPVAIQINFGSPTVKEWAI